MAQLLMPLSTCCQLLSALFQSRSNLCVGICLEGLVPVGRAGDTGDTGDRDGLEQLEEFMIG